jgi:hypothetical protein
MFGVCEYQSNDESRQSARSGPLSLQGPNPLNGQAYAACNFLDGEIDSMCAEKKYSNYCDEGEIDDISDFSES